MNLLHRKIVTPILVILVGWLGLSVWQIHGQRVGVAGQVKDLESKIAEVQSNNQYLASSSAYFSSDAYLERQARLKLNYKLPDEQVAFVYPDNNRVKVASGEQALKANLATLPNWKKWWRWMMGN